MRLCSKCKKEDRPWYEDAPCSCGVAQGIEPTQPNEHAPDCKCLGHEVVFYPVRIEPKDIAYDSNGTASLASAYRKQQGWKLLQNGNKFYRVKLLCRVCIEVEMQAQAQHREYQKACKAARGEDIQTYAQMLASQ